MASIDISPPSTSANQMSKPVVVCVLLSSRVPPPPSSLTADSCGSSKGTSDTHLEAARALAHAFAKHKISLVYGGGTGGIMGEIAKTLVTLSGPESVHGIIPEALIAYEQAGRPGADGVTASKAPSANDGAIFGRTTVVRDMHSRKQLMAEEVMKGGPGSGFVALSGGYGTLEELMEMTTWNQLGIHSNGVVVFNVDGYYDGIIQWVKTAVSAGFIAGPNAGILVEALDAEEVVRQLKDYRVSKHRLDLDWTQK